MGKRVAVELVAWNRFYSRNLLIAPELLGHTHTFVFDGYDINVKLPSAERLAGFYTNKETFVDDRISVRGYQTLDEQGRRRPQPLPLVVEVCDVDVVVSIPGNIGVPDKALTRQINAYELFPEPEQEELNSLADDYGNIARRAFDLWIRTVRWKADNWRIGLPEMSGESTGWGTYLKEKNSKKNLWAGPFRIVGVVPIATVTPTVWAETAAVLSSGQSPPVYYDLLYDALIHLDRKDLQRALVDAAVATEAYIRTMVEQGFPTDLDEPIRKPIDKLNFRPVMNKFFPARLDADQRRKWDKKLRSNLNKLFDDRNDIMHSGRKEGLTAPYCQRLIDSVGELLDLVPDRAI